MCHVGYFQEFQRICSSNVHFQGLERNVVTWIAIAVSCNWPTLYLPPGNQFCYWSLVLTTVHRQVSGEVNWMTLAYHYGTIVVRSHPARRDSP